MEFKREPPKISILSGSILKPCFHGFEFQDIYMTGFHNKELNWYIEKLKNNEYFSFGTYGDGEIRAMDGNAFGETNALGEVYTTSLCDDLRETLTPKEGFLYGTDENILPWVNKVFKKIMGNNFIDRDWYDGVVWDRSARLGELAPFIRQINSMNLVLVGNHHLRKLDFLKYEYFIEISENNCHTQLNNIVEECKNYGKGDVYLFSMGLPASVACHRLCGTIPNASFIDVGGMWDCFCGIGRQRGWRQELYGNSEEMEKWRTKNLEGI